MKELLALHEKILALPEDGRPEEGINFSRAEEDQEGVDSLPEDLQAEVNALRGAINAVVPEDFEYFAFAGDTEEEPSFGLDYNRGSAGGSHGGDLVPERSLVEQLRDFVWEERRNSASEHRQSMEDLVKLMDRLSRPPRAAKAVQREFREEMQRFVREKRGDASRLHLMYWDEEHEMMEIHFETAEELRDVLPGMIARGSEVVTVVAWGKPLPVERIDALMIQGQQALRERMARRAEEAREESEGEVAGAEEQAPAQPSDAVPDAPRQA